ncbi:unnamed protein product [Penicillium pancosmium]
MWGTNAVSDMDWTNQASILPFGCTGQNLSQLHPSGEKVPALWEIFKQHCDKLIKILHVPSVEPLVFQASHDVGRIPKGLEALMMAVYFNVVSQSYSEIQFATEQALACAGLAETVEIIILQAFTIFLTAARINNSARRIWTLTALLVRLAQNAGVHRNEIHFNLSPFVVEMRRRLWWCICVLDSRACEDTGYDTRIHELYIQQLGLSDPFSWFTCTISHTVFTKMWLATYHPFLKKGNFVGSPRDITDQLFTTSTVMIEYWLRLNAEESTRNWKWLCETGEEVDRAWKAVEGVLQLRSSSHSFSGQLQGVGGCRQSNAEVALSDSYKPLGKLLGKARSARMSALHQAAVGAGENDEQALEQHTSQPFLDAEHGGIMNWIYSGLTAPIDRHIFEMSWQGEHADYYYEQPFDELAFPSSHVHDDLFAWTLWSVYPPTDLDKQ